MSEMNLVSMRFAERSKAFEALSELRRAHDDARVVIHQAVILERDGQGRLEIADRVDYEGASGTATGGLIGAVIGLLAGPLGALLGLGVGALAGAAGDAARDDRSDSGLAAFSRSVEAGSTVVVADLEEFSPAVVDDIAVPLGGTVTRRATEQVQDEMDAADEATARAADEADRALRERRKAQKRAHREEKRAERHAEHV